MPSSRHPLRLLRWTFVFFPALLGAQGLPSGRPEQLGFSGDGLARVTSVVQAYVDSGLIAGAAFVVVRNGEIAWRGTSGFMDLEARTPMRPDALFRICSMTKPITAAAAMQLVEQGKLALDAPVSNYLPAFAEAKVYAGGPSSAPTLRDAARPIRVEDLMLHTAGLGSAFQVTTRPSTPSGRCRTCSSGSVPSPISPMPWPAGRCSSPLETSGSMALGWRSWDG